LPGDWRADNAGLRHRFLSSVRYNALTSHAQARLGSI
jgi:hypothetical protein